MAVTPSSPVVGVFTDRSMAEQAVGALYHAGFEHEQMRYSVPGNAGSFFEGLKSLFTGTSTYGGELANDLTSMGLSDEEARYYSNEYSNGNVILAVQARGREQEAWSILHRYGAYTSQDVSNQATTDARQPSESARQDTDETSQHRDDAQNWQTQPQFGTSAAPPFESHGQDVVTPEHASEAETRPVQANRDAPDDAESMPAQADVAAPEAELANQVPQASTAAPDYATEDRTAQADMSVPARDLEAQSPQANAIRPEQTDELQQLQEQLQAARQQLQEAKAQLQAAKERETQLQTAREREQQLQTTRRQLQEVQSELAATLAELRETQARLAQYE
jgi:Heat induced stress protein YflT